MSTLSSPAGMDLNPAQLEQLADEFDYQPLPLTTDNEATSTDHADELLRSPDTVFPLSIAPPDWEWFNSADVDAMHMPPFDSDSNYSHPGNFTPAAFSNGAENPNGQMGEPHAIPTEMDTSYPDPSALSHLAPAVPTSTYPLQPGPSNSETNPFTTTATAAKDTRAMGTLLKASPMTVAAMNGVNLFPSIFSACVACHRRKVACIRTDVLSPSGVPACARCVTSGVQCLERDHEDVVAAKQRRARKRRQPASANLDLQPSTKQPPVPNYAPVVQALHSELTSVATSATGGKNNSPNGQILNPPTSNSTDSSTSNSQLSSDSIAGNQISSETSPSADGSAKYSSLFLSALQRQRVMETWRVNDRQVATMLMAHSNGSGVLCRATRLVLAQLLAQQMHQLAHLAEHLTVDDFNTFLEPIRAEQKDAQKELIGHLPLWIEPSTRPFFMHFLPGEDRTSSQTAVTTDAPIPVSYPPIPSADPDTSNDSTIPEYRSEMVISSARNLLDWAAARCDIRLESTTGGPASLAAFKFLSDPTLNSMFRSIDCYRMCEGEIDRHRASLLAQLSGTEQSLANADANQSTNTSPANQFKSRVNEDSPSISEQPSTKRTSKSINPHAVWCTCRTTSVESKQPEQCNCFSSTPLLTRIGTNAAFGCLFGWNRNEVLAGLSRERSTWLRRLYAEEEWHEMIEYAVARVAKASRAINGFMRGLRATNAATKQSPHEPVTPAIPNPPVVACSPVVAVGDASTPQQPPPRCAYTRYFLASNRWGGIIPCAVAKWVFAQPLRFQYLIQWCVRNDVND